VSVSISISISRTVRRRGARWVSDRIPAIFPHGASAHRELLMESKLNISLFLFLVSQRILDDQRFFEISGLRGRIRKKSSWILNANTSEYSS
jgi:hypothetical protein